jgi:hypothetical protein
MDPIPATRSAITATRASAPATRTVARNRRSPTSAKRTAPATLTSRFAACLHRCSIAGLRLIITAPGDSGRFTKGIGRVPQRRIDPAAHAQWDTAYRVFCGRSRQPHDRGSWRILAVDRDDRVVGAITARFFCGEVKREYLHVLSLLGRTGPVFREHCELAIAELIEASAHARRTPAEISHWAVAPVWHAALIAVTLERAMQALVGALDAPIIVMAADNRRGEVNRLMRIGCTPLGLAGHSCLPPFVHHDSGAWLRLLAIDSRVAQARNQNTSADLALLQQRASIISAT